MESIDVEHPDFWKPRRCLREPIDEIFEAAKLLSLAADAHLAADYQRVEFLIRQADRPAIKAWTESLMGSTKNNPNSHIYFRYRVVENAPEYLAKSKRERARMPHKEERTKILQRYGRNCVFCEIPLIDKKVRNFIHKSYPQISVWGPTNSTRHAAFQCMTLQYDHILPHSRGGKNDADNVVPTCAGCNYGRWHKTIEEVGLIDPRAIELTKTTWDGLERLLPSRKRE